LQHFINSIPGPTAQKPQEILLHLSQSGGLFGGTVIGHLGRHIDFAFLFVRRARAAACVDAWPNNVTGLALNGPIVLLTMFGVVASLSLFLGVS